MEEKEPIKVKLSTVLLIIAIIVIVAIGVIIGIMYKQSITKKNNVINSENVMLEENSITNTEKNLSEAEIKDKFQSFLNLFGAYQGSPYSVLEEMKKITGKNVIDDEYPEGIKYNEEYILPTNLKYAEFKEFMLNYMTEEFFKADFAPGYVNKDEDLYCKSFGATGVEYEVKSVEKENNSDTKYKSKVDMIYTDENKEEVNIFFEIKNNNDKCVISSITMPSENMEDVEEDEKEETSSTMGTNTEDSTNLISTSSKIDWEKYPVDIDKQNEKWLGIDESLNNSVSYNLMKKTLYSLSKKNDNTFMDIYYSKLGIGDSTKIIDWTSNYSRYCYPDNKNNNLSAKYTKKITYDIALFNESYYDGYYDLETLVKNQYNKLNTNNYYYEISKLLIMNGNNESENDFKNNARAKKIRVTINKDKQYTFNLKDTNKVQVFNIDYKQNNIKTPVNMEVEVLEKYNGEKTNDVYISDVQFGINSNIPQGR